MSDMLYIKKNDVIFREGDSGDCLYMISGEADAQVAIYANYGTNREVCVATLRVGDYFGEMALLGQNVRTATAVALTPVDLEVIKEADFHDFAVSHPDSLLEIVHNATGRLRKLTRDYKAACVTLSKYVDAKESGQGVPEDVVAAMEKFA